MKGIAYYLNSGASRCAGSPGRSRVHGVLADPLYTGDYYFNRLEGKNGKTSSQRMGRARGAADH